jgi:hypothetical protein
VVAVIYNEFEVFLKNFQKELSLGEFVEFAKQLEQAGYVINVHREGDRRIIAELDKTGLIDLGKRFLAIVLRKRLKFNSWQYYVYKQKIHCNYKNINLWRPGFKNIVHVAAIGNNNPAISPDRAHN